MVNRNVWKNRLKTYGFKERDIIDMYCEDVVNIDNVLVGMEGDDWDYYVYTYKGITYLKGWK